MNAEESQAEYRKKCTFRRRRNVIEQINDAGEWVLYFTDKSISAVKRKSREIQAAQNKLYTVC